MSSEHEKGKVNLEVLTDIQKYSKTYLAHTTAVHNGAKPDNKGKVVLGYFCISPRKGLL